MEFLIWLCLFPAGMLYYLIAWLIMRDVERYYEDELSKIRPS